MPKKTRLKKQGRKNIKNCSQKLTIKTDIENLTSQYALNHTLQGIPSTGILDFRLIGNTGNNIVSY